MLTQTQKSNPPLIQQHWYDYAIFNFLYLLPNLLVQVVSKSPLSRTIRSVKLKPKDGTLEKQTKTGKKWNSRFFELEASKLHYYERKGGKYCDTIRLSSTTPVTIDVSDTRVIEIKTDSRLWYLRAESEGSASEWVAALKSHCQGINR